MTPISLAVFLTYGYFLFDSTEIHLGLNPVQNTAVYATLYHLFLIPKKSQSFFGLCSE